MRRNSAYFNDQPSPGLSKEERLAREALRNLRAASRRAGRGPGRASTLAEAELMEFRGRGAAQAIARENALTGKCIASSVGPRAETG